ncbi:uncharacterized protein LOC143956660 [Lithobates pipiens]
MNQPELVRFLLGNNPQRRHYQIRRGFSEKGPPNATQSLTSLANFSKTTPGFCSADFKFRAICGTTIKEHGILKLPKPSPNTRQEMFKMSSLLLHFLLCIASKWCFRPLNGLTSSSLSPVMTNYPPSPSFSVSPSRPLYETGDTITMTCSPPNKNRVNYIRYFKDNIEIHKEETSTGKEQHTVVLKTKTDEGSYSCGYVKIIDKSEVLSYGSELIDIRISDSTISWIYYLTGGSIILITFMIAFLLFKHKRKRNNLKEAPESRGHVSQQSSCA